MKLDQDAKDDNLTIKIDNTNETFISDEEDDSDQNSIQIFDPRAAESSLMTFYPNRGRMNLTIDDSDPSNFRRRKNQQKREELKSRIN